MADYLHDMTIIQRFAVLNRKAMVDILFEGMGWEENPILLLYITI